MSFTVNTNVGAMAALQSLNQTNRDMSQVQSRINTGLNVASTKDDSAKFVIAEKLRGDIAGFQAVTSSLNNAKSVTDVAIAGTEQISNLLGQMRAKATEASDTGLDQASRDTIAKDLTSLKKQIATIISSSEFNGVNLLKTGGGTVGALKSLQDGDSATAGHQADTLAVANTGLQGTIETAHGTGGTGGGLGTAGADITLTNATAADELIDDIDVVMGSVKDQLSNLGSASRTVNAQLKFTSKLADVVEAGIGNLVDADLAKESAKLQALQVKTQLGLQALSIANQAPQSIVSLFR